MKRITTPRRPAILSCQPIQAAEALRMELCRYGISADVNDGYNLAVVSVCADLVVWTDGLTFWWRAGARHSLLRRAIYAWHPVMELDRAGRRVAFRHAAVVKRRNPPTTGVEVRRGDPV